MRRAIAGCVLVGLATGAAWSGAAQAALPVGAKAPDFTTQATLGGKEFSFSLANALKRGPVVLYFYPAAFTKGCTIEAHEFAAAIDRFKALHATVIGVSHDGIEKLDRFSVSDCQSKFPVAADPTGQVIAAYDAKLAVLPMSSRTSYVIATDVRVAYVYSDMNPEKHVENTLGAVKAVDAAGKPG